MLKDGVKYLTVGELQDCLSKVSSNYYVNCNKVGNLALLDQDMIFKGFIDFLLEGETILIDEEEVRDK